MAKHLRLILGTNSSREVKNTLKKKLLWIKTVTELSRRVVLFIPLYLHYRVY